MTVDTQTGLAFFEDAELVQILLSFIRRDGYFVTAYKSQRRIGEAFDISGTSGLGKCVLTQISTRQDALRQIAASGLDPKWFNLEYLWFYRARPLNGALTPDTALQSA